MSLLVGLAALLTFYAFLIVIAVSLFRAASKDTPREDDDYDE